ncbi:ATP-binding protein [Streptomyces sp. NBC_00536]|uniref:ATP-binding protein n=1 Tax=Streptomyces sp. NBC_00536 TaxID=2975769 RepID=UPI002E803B8C|nr:ATP-binding protein [Streptomyces sp. NBC_00536]WUC77355.1 ATP-binding protein [Streptomyces sp. NBC_00536]
MTAIGSDTGDPLRARPPLAGQRRRLALRGVRGHVAKGRDFTRTALRDWGWEANQTTEDALLVVSELLTNASLHAGGCDELVLTVGTALRIEVLDGDTELPAPRVTPRGAPGGHGLAIVQRLADRWGAVAHADGKAVWAEIDGARLTTGSPAPVRE